MFLVFHWEPKIFIINFIGGQIILDSRLFLKNEEAMDWRERFPQLPLDKKNKFKEGSCKVWGRRIYEGFSSHVIFLGKGKKRMMSFNR
jgi:hypothetical protein